jgi:ribosome-associated protein
MRRPRHPNPPAATDYAGPSKSQVKRDLHDLQDFGLSLLDLPDSTLDELVTDERLREALHELRRLTAHTARKRQMQYLGKLLREEDTTPLREALAARRAGEVRDKRALKVIEDWRERMLAGDEALAQWRAERPDADTPQLRALVRDARRERAGSGHGRAFRELHRAIRAALTPPK